MGYNRRDVEIHTYTCDGEGCSAHEERGYPSLPDGWDRIEFKTYCPTCTKKVAAGYVMCSTCDEILEKRHIAKATDCEWTTRDGKLFCRMCSFRWRDRERRLKRFGIV